MHNTIQFINRNVNENKKSNRLPRAYMVKVSKVDYGLFRASRSHNPAHNSCSMGPLPHYALIVGRVNTPFSHCKQACVGDGLLTL